MSDFPAVRQDQIPEAAWQRFNELNDEEKSLKHVWAGQVGTTIPRLFTQADSFILNPSNVGTGMIARMLTTDETVSAAFSFKNLMMLSKIGEYHHDNTEISDFINTMLAALKYPTWHESLESQASCHGFGFSGTEITSGVNEKLQRTVVRLSTYHPNTLGFEVDNNGMITPMGILQFVYQYNQWRNPNQIYPKIQYGWKAKNPFETPTDLLYPWRLPFFAQYGLVRIPRLKMIHHTSQPMTSFGSPYGMTSVRTAHLAWQLKVFLLKQMGVAVKRSATPTLWATARGGIAKVINKNPKKGHHHIPREETLTPRQAVRKILEDRETDDAIVTGTKEEGYDVEVLEHTADFEQLGGLLDRLDTRIFRAFLLPELVMTSGAAGSRSLGDKHFQIVDFIAAEDAKKFTGSIVNDMIEPLIRDNFGEQKNYGHFATRPQNIEERERLANIYASLTTSGWMAPYVKDDMEFVRKTLSLPKAMDKSFEINPDAAREDAEREAGGDGKTRVQVPKGSDDPDEPALREPAPGGKEG